MTSVCFISPQDNLVVDNEDTPKLEGFGIQNSNYPKGYGVVSLILFYKRCAPFERQVLTDELIASHPQQQSDVWSVWACCFSR